MRILFLADEFPWGPRYGYRIRLENVLRALATVGEVDLFAAVADDGSVDPASVPPDAPVHRCTVVPVGPAGSRVGRVARWAASSQPWRIVWRDWATARRALREWAAPRYDLVWYSHGDTFAGLGRFSDAPVVVDLDNLEDHTRRLARGVRASVDEGHATSRARHAAAGAIARIDEGRWRRTQDRIVASAARVVVCSDLDAARLGADNAAVVVNAYDAPSEPAGDRAPEARSLALLGRLTYPPNADGARFLIDDVLPLLRARDPDVTVRLVGRIGPDVAGLGLVPGVSVLGEVDDITAELARAAAVVVPVRYGSGTRIKILEAFANRIPVVSTSVGCEGLGAVPGRELLVADTAEEFASACARVLTDDGLRAALVDAAGALYASRFTWAHARDDVARVVDDVVGMSTAQGRGSQ